MLNKVCYLVNLKKQFYISLLFLILFPFGYNAKTANDSLLSLYYGNNHDSIKIKALHQYIEKNYNTPDSAIKYSDLAIFLSRNQGPSLSLAKSFNLKAISHYYKGELEICSENLDSALLYYKGLKNKKGIATCYNGKGVIYYDQGKLYKSLDIYIQSLRIKKKIGDKKSLAMTLNNIGNVYKDLEKFDKSLKYYNESLEIKKNIDDNHWIAMTLNNIGLLHHNNKKYKKALWYYSESIGIKREIEDLHGLAMSLNNIGLTYELINEYEKAIHFYEESIFLKEEIGDKYGLAMSLINIASTFREVGNFNQCFDYLNRSEIISKEIGAISLLRDCYKKTYETFDMQNKSVEAYKYYKLYITAKDSVMNEESIKNLQSLEARYGNEAKQLTIQNLENKKRLNEIKFEKNIIELKNKSYVNYSLIGVLIVCFLFLLLFYINSRHRKKINSSLKKSLKEKEVLFKEVHHRVKNNFQVISSLLNLHAENSDDDNVIVALGEAKNRISSMALVHEKLYQSEDLERINMNSYMSKLILDIRQSLKSEVDYKSIVEIDNIFIDIQSAIPIGLIINELVTNSIKYAFDNRINNEIKISLKPKGKNIEVSYYDNGVGMPSEFDFEDLDSLGLNLVKLLVLQLHGELIIKNENGLSFVFEFLHQEF